METLNENQPQKTKIALNVESTGYTLLKVISIVSFVIFAILLICAADSLYEYYDRYYYRDESDFYKGIIYIGCSINCLIFGGLLLGISTLVKTSAIQQAIYKQTYNLDEE